MSRSNARNSSSPDAALRYEEIGPWKRLDSKVVYQNPWIRVREDSVIRPDGNRGIYGVVETRIATGVVALTPEYEVFLIGQFRYPLNEYSWEIIEGGSDPEESALEAAKREMVEEAGLIASSWLQLGEEYHLSNCHSSEIGYVYLATGLSETEAKPEGTEVLQRKKVPFKDAIRMVDRGEIKDGLTIVGLYRAERYLRSCGISF